ncbi:MAG TPA: hypothetical protein VIT45_05305 [Allosphingosinicella sp.]
MRKSRHGGNAHQADGAAGSDWNAQPVRPNAIIWFERLSLAAWIADLLNVLTTPEIARVVNGTDDAGAAIVIFGSLIVTLALIFRVSRWRSRLAKWILIIFTLILLIGNAPLVLARMDWSAILVGLTIRAIQLLALALLFTPSARAWLAGQRNSKSPEALGRTFE